MLLTGTEIKKQIELGNIKISPFNEKQLNPNSYNVRVGNVIKRLDTGGTHIIDPKKMCEVKSYDIPKGGIILYRNCMYLAETVESTWSDKFVACLDGRSSYARLGLAVHITAGFGDLGYSGKWTLEIIPHENIILYPNSEIAQIYFQPVMGDNNILYNGKYQNATGVMASKSYLDFRLDFEKKRDSNNERS